MSVFRTGRRVRPPSTMPRPGQTPRQSSGVALNEDRGPRPFPHRSRGLGVDRVAAVRRE